MCDILRNSVAVMAIL